MTRHIDHLASAVGVRVFRQRSRRPLSVAVLSAALCALPLVGACKRHEPKADAAPQSARELPSDTRLISGNPRNLVLQGDDLPVRFAMSGGKPRGTHAYSHVYFNPEALLAPPGAEEKLLGVIVSLTLFPSATEADEAFTAQGGLDETAVLANVAVATPGAIAKSAAPYAITPENADRVLAFRVRYVLQDTDVVEYRLRLRVANAVANLIISSRITANGEEPATLIARVRHLTDRQLQRLESARR